MTHRRRRHALALATAILAVGALATPLSMANAQTIPEPTASVQPSDAPDAAPETAAPETAAPETDAPDDATTDAPETAAPETPDAPATDAPDAADAPVLTTNGSESVLWDPGPTSRCFSVITEPHDIPSFTWRDTSGCDEIDAQGRQDPNPNCWPTTEVGADGFPKYMGYVGAWGPTCPAWRINTWGWDHRTEWKKNPGFDVGITDGSPGESLQIALHNNARNLPADKVCLLRENTISYDYPPSALKRMPGLDENLTVTYNANVTGGGDAEDYGCATEQRSILTTDIIWVAPNPDYDPNWKPGDSLVGRWSERTHLISVVHYNPNDWSTAGAKPKDGVLWWNKCESMETITVGFKKKEKQVPYADGCRVTIAAPQYIEEGVTTPINIDVTALVKQYAKKYLGQGAKDAIDPEAKVRAVQVVSSNIGSDTVSVIDSIDFRAGS
ncbi:hypothetical protein [Microbacterium sp. 179-I 3D3 NHS]|uniref:hypothetical protein n=1 Tax=unclassified Microbacterium TaxID=2609290 RepID=UPI00399F0D13